MNSRFKFAITASLVAFVAITGCRTKADLAQEQQLKRLQQEVRSATENRSTAVQSQEEIKMEITRMSGLIDQQSRQLEALSTRVEQLNAKIDSEDRSAKSAPVKSREKASYEDARKLYEAGKYAESISVLQVIFEDNPKGIVAKKSQFLLAESYFGNKEFAPAALEYAQYKKDYPQDSLVAQATFQQARAFRNLGQKKESVLFYQEFLEKFPKHTLASQAKKELRTVQ